MEKHGFSHRSSGRAGLIFDCQSLDFELLSDHTLSFSLLKSYQVAGEPFPNYKLPESNTLYDTRNDFGAWQKPDSVLYSPFGNFQRELPCQSLATIGYSGKYLKSDKTSVQFPASWIDFDVSPGEWSFTAEY
jgi:hypothetical protein